MMPYLIHQDQTGFIPGRNIAHNIRKSLDVIQFAKSKQIPAAILSIDMEKCFDRISHDAIFNSFKYFNFGDNFINWIKLFYSKIEVCTQHFGYISDFFVKGRSTNQGCPFSPGAYLLTGDILANKLRSHPDIKGIKIGDIEYLISQFADDTDLYLSYDLTTFNAVLQCLHDIEANTGLKVSHDKTTVYRIGSIANSNAKFYTSRKLNWSNTYINTLGIDISNDKAAIVNKNFEKVFIKLRTTANLWYYRKMTLMGKILIVNALMTSLFVYRMQVLERMDQNMIRKINSAISDFIWAGKKPKIPLSVLQQSKNNGGLGLVNVEKKHEALTINWMQQCQENESIENLVKYFLKPIPPEIIWKVNLHSKDVETLILEESFWKQMYITWANYSHFVPQNRETHKCQILWFNSNFKINQKPIFFVK